MAIRRPPKVKSVMVVYPVMRITIIYVENFMVKCTIFWLCRYILPLLTYRLIEINMYALKLSEAEMMHAPVL